jgi:hypothetical protein
LYISLCKAVGNISWMSDTHSDGSKWDGWFILGLYKYKGNQITYHLPMKYWNMCAEFAKMIEKAYEFDGHTSSDVLDRLMSLSNDI